MEHRSSVDLLEQPNADLTDLGVNGFGIGSPGVGGDPASPTLSQARDRNRRRPVVSPRVPPPSPSYPNAHAASQHGGLEVPPEALDPLADGLIVELEHEDVIGDRDPDTLTRDDVRDALAIAEDHLGETGDYYEKLRDVEGDPPELGLRPARQAANPIAQRYMEFWEPGEDDPSRRPIREYPNPEHRNEDVVALAQRIVDSRGNQELLDPLLEELLVIRPRGGDPVSEAMTELLLVLEWGGSLENAIDDVEAALRGSHAPRAGMQRRAYEATPVATPEGLDAFTRSYLQTAARSSSDDLGEQDRNEGYPIDDLMNTTLDGIADEGLVSWSDEAIEQAKKECGRFQDENWDDIQYDLERAGHDFWLTRVGHGAGFWDGGWEEDVGRRLTEASKRFGEIDLYVGDDMKLYFTPGRPSVTDAMGPLPPAEAMSHARQAIRILLGEGEGRRLVDIPEGTDVDDLQDTYRPDPETPADEGWRSSAQANPANLFVVIVAAGDGSATLAAPSVRQALEQIPSETTIADGETIEVYVVENARDEHDAMRRVDDRLRNRQGIRQGVSSVGSWTWNAAEMERLIDEIDNIAQVGEAVGGLPDTQVLAYRESSPEDPDDSYRRRIQEDLEGFRRSGPPREDREEEYEIHNVVWTIFPPEVAEGGKWVMRMEDAPDLDYEFDSWDEAMTAALEIAVPWGGDETQHQAQRRPLAPGDKVRYAASFLQSIGAYTGALGQAVGTIKDIQDHGSSFKIATVDWGGWSDECPERVNVKALIRAGEPDYTGM